MQDRDKMKVSPARACSHLQSNRLSNLAWGNISKL